MNQLKMALEQLKIETSTKMLKTFQAYMEGILEWNEKINLTAITDKGEFIRKHYIDSLLCYEFNELQRADKIIDVGTGAGFPGIPLAIVFPEKQFVLMDSLKKRLNVIDELCKELGINNIVTLHGRAEDLARDRKHRERYDLCVARAVANIAVLAEYTMPFIKVGGSLLAYKGSDFKRELDEGQKSISLMGGKLAGERAVAIENLGLDHKIIIINKIKNTPMEYPRKAGTPSKEPLK
ncbi:MAG: 16S rRNA (guanine(527)-N(7))-methyltransferase RsmG [Peptostreptococcaceae bacterium]|nr:16S rRNA (guanine(527)-N(7))-methyltransferase RsmG [Peptostreptococcaceae bacterium]